MIDSSYQAPMPVKKVFPPMPKAVYPCELIDIVLRQEKDLDGNNVEKLNFTWVVLQEGKLYGRRAWAHCTPTLGQKSHLPLILKELTGHEVTDSERKNPPAFLTPDFLNSLVGIQKNLVIGQHTSKLGNVSNIIESYLDLPDKLPEFDESKIEKE